MSLSNGMFALSMLLSHLGKRFSNYSPPFAHSWRRMRETGEMNKQLLNKGLLLNRQTVIQSMDLRQRRAGNKSDEQKKHIDVSLGPAIYAGERYGKLSERLKRRGKIDTTSRTNQVSACL